MDLKTNFSLSYPMNFIYQLSGSYTINEFLRWVKEVEVNANIDKRFLKEKRVNIINLLNLDDFDRRIKEIIGKDSYIVIYRYRYGMTYERISEIKDTTSSTIIKKLDRIIKILSIPENRIRLVLDIDYKYYKAKKKEFESECIIKDNFDDDSLEFLSKNIHELQCFNTREKSVLTKANIISINDLIKYTETELLGIPNIGVKTINHIRQVLEEYGLVLRK